MKVTLEKTFPLPAPAETAWRLLQDVESVAGCMPGASITQRVDDSHYRGTVAVRMGPAALQFRGEVEVREVDPAARSLRLLGRGTDSTGTSGAAMDLQARIEAVDAASCRLLGTSEVSVSGKAAAFGGRLMLGVADQVLQQFVANFSGRLQAQADQPIEPQATPTPAPAPALSGPGLLWAMLRDWLRNLFGARHA